jgi:hypothetical protein
MRRLPDWEVRLHAYIEACAGAVFAWGELDCALFSAGAVLAMTGTDPAASFRGRYSTAVGSARALRRYGAGTLEATIDAGFVEKPLAFAGRGDLVMIDGAVGVCLGADALFIGEADGLPGLVRFARATWTKTWSVG